MFDNVTRRRATLAAIAPIALGLALYSGAAAYAQESVKIGVGMPITSNFGQQSQAGINLAVKEINDAGGILGGRPIEVIEYDDQSKAEESAAVFERLITRDQVKVVIGPIPTLTTGAALAVTKRYGVVHFPHVAKSTSLREQGYANAFFMNSTVDMDAEKYNAFIATELKPKTVVILAEVSDYGDAAIKILTDDWSVAGSPEITGTERFDAKDNDFSPVLTKIKGSNPEGVYIVASATETFATILRQMDELGITARKLPAPGIVTAGVIDLAGDSSEGLLFGDFYSAETDTPENKAFVEKFMAANNYTPGKIELTAYESVLIAAKALDKAGADADYDAIGNVIRETEWTTPRGTWKFQKLGESYQAPAGFVLLGVEGGKVVAK